MNVLLIGKNGQLAWELQQIIPDFVNLSVMGSTELDISDEKKVQQVFNQHHPDLVINAAAYTAVDKAETDTERAFSVNSDGVKYLAEACKQVRAKLIHISTDFVFDGSKNTPYTADDKEVPLGIYGESKYQGETNARDILGNDVTIIRTAWVYSQHGNNFVKTMLRLMQEKEQLGVIYDQVGTPTWAHGLAKMIWALVERHWNGAAFSLKSPRVLHWTDAGVASWYDFAVAIQDIAHELNILATKIPINPIPSSAYPTPARRPNFSVLDKTEAESVSNMNTNYWREHLKLMLKSIRE